MKKEITIELSKKKSHNNNFERATTFEKESQVFEGQETLFGLPKIKSNYKLNKNQKHLLEIFALNPYSRLSRNMLIEFKSINMHINTVSNFIKDSEIKGFIEKQRIVPGAIINTAYYYQKYPNTFEDGIIVKNSSATYYRITKLGLSISKLNESKI